MLKETGILAAEIVGKEIRRAEIGQRIVGSRLRVARKNTHQPHAVSLTASRLTASRLRLPASRSPAVASLREARAKTAGGGISVITMSKGRYAAARASPRPRVRSTWRLVAPLNFHFAIPFLPRGGRDGFFRRTGGFHFRVFFRILKTSCTRCTALYARPCAFLAILGRQLFQHRQQ